MQRLGVPQNGCHGLDTRTSHVVERVLFRKRPTGSLRVGTQRHGFRVFRTKAFHDFCPQQTCRTHLGNLHEMVHANGPKERQTRRECVDVDSGVHSGAQVVHTVGQCVGQLDVRRGTGFLHVVTGNGNGVELRHLL